MNKRSGLAEILTMALALGAVVLSVSAYLRTEEGRRQASVFGGPDNVLGTATADHSFPSSLSNVQDGDTVQAGDWNNVESAIGTNTSTVTSSLSWQLRATTSTDPGHKHTTGTITGYGVFTNVTATTATIGTLTLTSPLTIGNGGVGTTTTPGVDAILMGNGTSYELRTFSVAGQARIATTTTSVQVSASSSYPLTFVIENPNSTEDDCIFTAKTTTTVDRIYAVNKSVGDTATFNITHASSRSTATSSAQQLFAAYQAVTATTTASCFASPTSTGCTTGTFGTNASTTISSGATVRLTTTAASSSQFGITLWVTEQ